MTGKEQVVEELGELLLPNMVNKALAANDRAKYLMTLLQMAREHADHPESPAEDLQSERTNCGIAEASFDKVPESSAKIEGCYRIPQVERIHGQIIDNLRDMIAPLEMEDGERQYEAYQQRLSRLIAESPSLAGDQISGEYIDRITAARADHGDSFHVLVMHLHKELNRLQQQIAVESVEGARAYALTDDDRPLVAAFMRGVNRTRQLKFDHPGLDTTATHTSQKLVIQNDIGTTDAHVLVIHVKPPKAIVTYTDVHIQRLLFFQSLFRGFAVRWEDTRSKRSRRLTESVYHLSTGTFTAGDTPELEQYLEFLGSRLVFLIDWNRARKRLRKLAPKRVVLDVLGWAADQDFGHMAFLKVGGEQMVFDALQLSSRAAVQIGGQLSDIIGPERAAEFLKFTLKTAAEGLLAGDSELLIRDEVRAELHHYLDTVQQGLLELAAEHAALIVELATAACDSLLPAGFSDAEYVARTARRAQKWEHRADQLVSKARSSRGEQAESKAIAELLRIADDAADDLEEGIFLLTLFDPVSPTTDSSSFVPSSSRHWLQDLGKLLARTAQEYLKSVENARHIHRGSSREEMADFLKAVDDTISLEHQIDDAHRRAKASIVTSSTDHRQLHLCAEVADNLESASDAMMRAALTLRDYVLGEVITR